MILQWCCTYTGQNWMERMIDLSIILGEGSLSSMMLYFHRSILDGQGSKTVFNGHEPLIDGIYTRVNRMFTGMSSLVLYCNLTHSFFILSHKQYTMQCSAVQCSAVQCSAVQCSAVQCSAVQCNAMQCNAMQCNKTTFIPVWTIT